MSCKKQSAGITMHERLSIFLAEDSEDRLWHHIIRRIEDPLQPRTSNSRVRVNPILFILGSIALVSVGIFVFFSYGPR